MSSKPPMLTSARLVLRPFEDHDLDAFRRVHGTREVADGVLTVPHPFTHEAAVERFNKIRDSESKGQMVAWGIEERDRRWMIGVIGIHVTPQHGRGVLGYVLEPPFWGRGYMTEALARAADFVFTEATPPLNKLSADFFPENPASGRVLAKLGFRRATLQPQEVMKHGVYRDVVRMDVLREEWGAGQL